MVFNRICILLDFPFNMLYNKYNNKSHNSELFENGSDCLSGKYRG